MDQALKKVRSELKARNILLGTTANVVRATHMRHVVLQKLIRWIWTADEVSDILTIVKVNMFSTVGVQCALRSDDCRGLLVGHISLVPFSDGVISQRSTVFMLDFMIVDTKGTCLSKSLYVISCSTFMCTLLFSDRFNEKFSHRERWWGHPPTSNTHHRS
jgi:hypothetical protein